MDMIKATQSPAVGRKGSELLTKTGTKGENRIMEYMPNHRSNSARYCPSCGGEVEETGASAETPSRHSDDTYTVLNFVLHLFEVDPMMAELLMLRVANPAASYRTLAQRMGCGKTKIWRLSNQLADNCPELKTLVLPQNKKAQSLRARARGAQART